jgi:intein-encoded DNA endonuclease-like protein
MIDKRLKYPNLNPSENLFYLLGAIKSDGWIAKYGYQNKICLEVNDLDFATEFSKCLIKIGLNPNINKIKKKLSNQEFVFRVTSNSRIFVDWFKSYDLNNIKMVSKKMKIAFIRGIFDGEGCYKTYPKSAHRKYHVAQITMKDKKFILFVQELIKSIGFENKVYKCDNSKGWSGILYNIWISGNSAKTIEFLQTIKPSIERKRYNYKNEEALHEN